MEVLEVTDADPVVTPSLVIGGITAAASTGLSLYGAAQKNSAISSAAEEAKKRAGQELDQQSKIVGVQTTRARQAAERVQGLIKVSAAARGLGAGGSAAALDRDAAQQEGLDQYGIKLNQFGAQNRVLAQLANVNATLSNESQDPFVAGLGGALQGFGTGISIAGGLKNLGVLDGSGAPR